MIRNTIIAVLFLCFVGLLGYILGRDYDNRSSPQVSVEQGLPTVQMDTQESIRSALTNEKAIIGDHTISYQRFDPPLMAWKSGYSGTTEIEVFGIALNKLDENQNELLLLSKIEVKVGGHCGAGTMELFRRVLNEDGDLSASTSVSRDCGESYTTLNDQWIAFVVESKLRDFHLWLAPTSPSQGDTPTGDMYISVVDSQTIKVRLE